MTAVAALTDVHDSGRLHTARTTANIDKVKDLAVVHGSLRIYSLSEKKLLKRFAPYFSLTAT